MRDRSVVWKNGRMEVMVREGRLFASGQRNDGKMHAVDPKEVMRHAHVMQAAETGNELAVNLK